MLLTKLSASGQETRPPIPMPSRRNWFRWHSALDEPSGRALLACATIAHPMRFRYICIHGHFYQPPRENPWLEAVETQDSAHPYHDWNERITAECYGPNASSRILDTRDLITKIVNNYASISFNFGPTLLSWLAPREPEVYAAILDADRLSRVRYEGHGSA